MSAVDELYALVPASEAERAVRALERHGVLRSEITVREVASGRYLLHDEQLHEGAAGARHGAEIGAGLGAVVGIVAALFVPVLRDASVVGMIVAAFGGSGFGALVGAMTGLQLRDARDDDPVSYEEVADTDAFRLVEVRCLHLHRRAHHVLERQAGVRFVDTPAPVA